MQWNYRFGSFFEEEVEEEIEEPVVQETETEVKRAKPRFKSKSKKKTKMITKLDQINEEENESNSGSEGSDLEQSAAKDNIHLDELSGVNTRCEVAGAVNPNEELNPAERRIRNRSLINRRKKDQKAKKALEQ